MIKTSIITALTILSAVVTNGQPNTNANWKPYSVKDFGATGDGITDDTDAIQRCITTAEKKVYRYYHAESAYPEVVFPAGKYIISRPIVIAATDRVTNLSIRGEGKVTVTQKNPDKDIFYMHHGYRQSVDNITFTGGKIQVKFFSRNLNRAQLLVRNCRFVDSSSYAVDDSMRGFHHSKIVAPYKISWKNSLPYATETNVNNLPDIYFTSTILHIDHCEFVNCMKAARIFADWGIISNTRITTNPEMQGAAIYSRGVLKIKNTKCFAKVTKNRGQRFVDNIQAGVIMQNVTIDTDGSGICPIYNRRVYDNGGLYNVYAVIENCNIKAAGAKENCFVYCEEVPNLISITNSREISGRTIPAIGFRMQVTKKYLQYVSFPELVKRLPELARIYGYMVRMPRIYDIPETKYKYNFAFSLHGNKNLDCRLPAVLRQFLEKPLPKQLMAGFSSPGKHFSLKPARKANSLNVYSFGAKGDGLNDDTAAIQKAVDAAGKRNNAELVFPNGLYKISTPVTLPENLLIRGSGLACFKGDNGTKTLFRGKNIQQLSFVNIGFYKVENAIEINTDSTAKSNILFEHCFFSDINGVAVSCLSGNGLAGEKNLTALRITDCTYDLPGQALATNAGNALFDCNWLSLIRQAKPGTLLNKGTMRIIDNVGVPSVTAPALWVDNRHTVIVDNMRFGGEGNFQKDLIENNSRDGKIYMRYSWWFCDKGSVILCRQTPEVAVLFANFGIPDANWQTMVTMEGKAKGQKTDFLFESCNISPANFK